METNDPGGSLADVQAARRATRVVTTPWWLRAYHTDLVEVAGLITALIVGNVLAVVFRGHDALWHYPVAILALLAIVGASQFAAHRLPTHGAESATA